MNRRKFLQNSLLGSLLYQLTGRLLARVAGQPNILWLTSEDHGPHLGCYGDRFANTPNLDALAQRGMQFKRAWSTAPVCAPARTALISGVYPPSLGAEHMRSQVPLPDWLKLYPQYLREAGYYCSNNWKEDYNLIQPDDLWDDSSQKGHWRDRAEEQPFLAVFNHRMTHESRIRAPDANPRHDPAQVRVPAYLPDTPEVRSNWAQYYDRLTELDTAVGERLQELEAAGLAPETIVFFCSDHGPGFPRSKRWPYNAGLHVPLIVYFPDKWRHLAPRDYAPGAQSQRLVDFLDFAPTLLSLAGVQPPAYLPGRAFAGVYQQRPKPYLHACSGRQGERYDLSRSVTDGRFVYLRNYMPHRIYGQHIAYMFETQTTQVWKQQYDQGRLNAAQRQFWETKPPEELYDLDQDIDEVNNLVNSPRHQAKLRELRWMQQDWLMQVRDLGFLPENELETRASGLTPYEVAQDQPSYPLERIARAAELASSLRPEVTAELLQSFNDPDSAVRYWAALGLLMRQAPGVSQGRQELQTALADPAPAVRVVAAEALGRYGNAAELEAALATLAAFLTAQEDPDIFILMMALAAIDAMEDRARPLRSHLEALQTGAINRTRPAGVEIDRLRAKILRDWE
ncbi:MAG: sulfatase-like hydrolase/transferase [Cyanobacteria bacterium P01_G01_bin.54]